MESRLFDKYLIFLSECKQLLRDEYFEHLI